MRRRPRMRWETHSFCVSGSQSQDHLGKEAADSICLSIFGLHAQAHLVHPGIHADDADLHLLAHLELVLHALHEPILDLRDVHKAARRGVAVWRLHLHEGAEAGDSRDRARNPGGRIHPLEGGQVNGLPLLARRPARSVSHGEAQLVRLGVRTLELHPYLLAHLDEVVDVLHEGVRDLGHVHQALRLLAAVQGDGDEGAERGDVGNLAVEPLADLVHEQGGVGSRAAAAGAVRLALDHGQAELAVVAQTADPDLDLLVLLELSVDVIDPVPRDGGDVQEPFALGADVHERAEIPDVPHGAGVLLADLELVEGYGRDLHVLGAHGALLRPAVRVVPLHLERAVVVALEHHGLVHHTVLRKLG
mmetsp:Transcript_125073/g.335712  ORF Transcript_125073/g.335712 Transcript_125073/m.335712 type:complete len:361 (-) Transcript_125073:457-1539(-)